MNLDPTIDAIYEVRHQISASVDHDARKLVEYYRKLQQRHSHRILSSRSKGMEIVNSVAKRCLADDSVGVPTRK